MDHIGIDLGSRDSQVCVRNSGGEIIEESRRATIGLGPWLAGRDSARVVFETSTGAFRLASMAQQYGHDVRVVAATLVRSLGVGQRGLKNDVRDARTLSEASCRIELPSVHIPSVGQPGGEGDLRLPRGAHQAADAARESGAQLCPVAAGSAAPSDAGELPKKVRRALLVDAEGLPAHLERLLVVLETLSEQIAEADAELKELAREDAACVG